MSKLKVVFQDRYLAVLYKPQGFLVYKDADSGQTPDCVTELQKRLPGQRVFPVHRLDKDTSGLLVVALDPTTASQLTRWFRNQRVQKTYWALVEGVLKPAHGALTTPLQKKKSKETELSRTEYRTLKTTQHPKMGPISLIECQPKTGRFHQIRRHLKLAGCPIVGDTQYGKKESKISLCLSAIDIAFAHPRTRKMLRFKSEPHPSMAKRIHAAFLEREDVDDDSDREVF